MDEKIEKDAIRENISEWLALGFSDVQIIGELQTVANLDEKEAQAALKDLYAHWQDTRDAVDLREADLVAWHVFLRKRILQKMIARADPAGQRVALAVLDSLATIQGIAVATSQTIPLKIVMKEKKDDTTSPDTPGEHEGRS